MLSPQTFTYAVGVQGRMRRTLIRTVETVTGRPRLQRLYFEYQRNPSRDESFWEAAVRKLELSLRFDRARLEAIPRRGPVVVVANHPFGVLDGIVISYLVSRVRPDFKVLTNSVLYRAEEIRPHLLPIDFSETRAALKVNLATRAAARDWVDRGGVLVAFPGGTVSTAPTWFGRAEDPAWKPFTAELILRSRATVVPIYFEGQNSRLFQMASQLSQTLRLSLLFKEVVRRIGSEMVIRVGRPVPYAAMVGSGDKAALVEDLRQRTYALGQVPSASLPGLKLRLMRMFGGRC